MTTQRPTTDLHLLDLRHPALTRLSWDDRWAQALLHRPTERRRDPRPQAPARARRRPEPEPEPSTLVDRPAPA